jgi:zinc transport system substrate-binding protein
MERSARAALLATAALGTVAVSGQALALDGVVASIKPVHSLVAAVMEGVGEPQLLVGGAGSPHSYTMRPSEARMLESASLVFWVGGDLEMFLSGPLATLAADATVIELSQAHDLVKLPYREGGPFETHEHEDGEAHASHDHDGHDHEGHDHAGHEDEGHDHAAHEDAHQDHVHEDHAHDDHAHGDAGHDHAHGTHDMHFWLDPENARAFVLEIEEALAAADPDNAARYAANAEAVAARLDGLIEETQAALAPVRDRSFIVFHDAYQYYERRFGIEAAGSITVSPEVLPGAQRLAQIQERIRETGAACVFAEPQFEPRLVDVAVEGTEARSGVLDPLGADLADGPELYFELIGNLTGSLVECLSAAS